MDVYIEQLALFGTNMIEMVAPDGDPSPLFPISPNDMLVAMATSTKAHGLNLSMWYPFEPDDETFGSAWANLTHLDMLFVPGGDPGDTSPRVLWDILPQKIKTLPPGCQVWLSNQGLNQTWSDEFYELLADEGQSGWLDGVVYGPHTRDTLATGALLAESGDQLVCFVPMG